jgi:IS4 transposase
MNVKYLMPSRKDKRTKKMFDKHLKETNFAVVRHNSKNKKGEWADFNLIMIREHRKEFGYVTNIPFLQKDKYDFCIKLYQRRWNIETGYRLQNMFLAKTGSRNPSVRLFYFSYAVALHNLWIVIRGNGEHGKYDIPVLMFTFALIVAVIAEYFDVSLLTGPP